MEIDFTKLNRFTTIPFLLDLLFRKKLTLLNPSFWEDFNDRETIEIYRKAINAKSIYVLCLTYKDETIHHWNAFANGTSGCCIQFKAHELINLLDKENILHGKTEYIRVHNLTSYKYETKKLPYVKRAPFEPESEYRIIVTSNDDQKPSFDIDINLQLIEKITISNKMPKITYGSLKELIEKNFPDFTGRIHRSTLYNNTRWIKYFSNQTNGS